MSKDLDVNWYIMTLIFKAIMFLESTADLKHESKVIAPVPPTISYSTSPFPGCKIVPTDNFTN